MSYMTAVLCPHCNFEFTTSKEICTCPKRKGGCGKSFRAKSNPIKDKPIQKPTIPTKKPTKPTNPYNDNKPKYVPFTVDFLKAWPKFSGSVDSLFKSSKWSAMHILWGIIKRQVEERM